MEEKIIELSKTKIMLGIFGSLAFVALGIWLIPRDPFIGWLSILFFGFTGIRLVIEVFNKKAGLIFNSMGIVINRSNFQAGLVPWNDIAGFSIFEVKGTKMLVILLKEPEKYIEMGNSIRRNLNKINYQMSGSPIAIASSTLKISFDELMQTAQDFYDRYGNDPQKFPL
jgi:hypothetical protein